ncbi:unnamed protein product [Pedinophyceae sp. YPF-701]|nr:unnamed protein product [Pedinophyceae sp. YPF-701]
MGAVGDVVKEGDHVVLDVNVGDKLVLAQAKPNGKIKVGKAYVSIGNIIGQPWGAVFEPASNNRELVRVDDPRQPINVIDGTQKDNRDILFAGDQALTAEDIAEMQRAGTAGAEIIDALTKSSATFEAKTEFSQEKYLRKKQKKYTAKVTVRRPTTRHVAAHYFLHDPRKVHGLRTDSLALMLAQANVGAHARVLAVDQTGGLLTAAALERTGGFGTVCGAVLARRKGLLDALRVMNFSQEELETVHSCLLWQLWKEPGADVEGNDAGGGEGDKGEGEAVKGEGGEGERGGVAQRRGGGFAVKKCTDKEVRELAERKFTSLLVCAPMLQPLPVLRRLWRVMEPSASFAVWAQSAQTLAETLIGLQQEQMAVAMSVQECWWREHQVLPQRTHPNMNMSGTGGFVLCGTFVARDDDEAREEHPEKKQRVE